MLKKTGNGNFVWKGNMQVRELLKALIIAERVKDTTRHHKNFKLMKRRYIVINSKKLNRVAVIISLSEQIGLLITYFISVVNVMLFMIKKTPFIVFLFAKYYNNSKESFHNGTEDNQYGKVYYGAGCRHNE